MVRVSALAVGSVLISATSVRAADPTELKICLLVPTYRASGGAYDSGGHNRLGGALSANKEINNKSDGFWDTLLPDTTITYEWYNSARDSATGMFTAIECATSAFSGTGAVRVCTVRTVEFSIYSS